MMLFRLRGGGEDAESDDSGDILGNYVELNAKRPAEHRAGEAAARAPAKAQKTDDSSTPKSANGSKRNGTATPAQRSPAKLASKARANGSIASSARSSAKAAASGAAQAAVENISSTSSDDTDDESDAESMDDEAGGEDDESDAASDESASGSSSEDDDEQESDSDSDILAGDDGAPVQDLKLNIDGRSGAERAQSSGRTGGGSGGGVDESLPIAERYKHLQGVRIVEDMEADGAAMEHVKDLLRVRRYHDDNIDEAPRAALSITRCAPRGCAHGACDAPRSGLRPVRRSAGCFKCGLPGHMARECTNNAKPQICVKCAATGHTGDVCPNGLCFKCFQPGHMARDCPNGFIDQSMLLCVRCGKASCQASGQADWTRSVHGCSERYADSDLQHVSCFVCGRKRKHCSCQAAPKRCVQDPPQVTCCLCGEEGHTGLLDDCGRLLPEHLAAERNSQRARARSGGGGAGQFSHDAVSGRYNEGGRGGGGGSGGDRGGQRGYMWQHDDRDRRQYGARASGTTHGYGHDAERYAQTAAQYARGGGAGGGGYGPQRYGYESHGGGGARGGGSGGYRDWDERAPAQGTRGYGGASGASAGYRSSSRASTYGHQAQQWQPAHDDRRMGGGYAPRVQQPPQQQQYQPSNAGARMPPPAAYAHGPRSTGGLPPAPQGYGRAVPQQIVPQYAPQPVNHGAALHRLPPDIARSRSHPGGSQSSQQQYPQHRRF